MGERNFFYHFSTVKLIIHSFPKIKLILSILTENGATLNVSQNGEG
jgi:hypothetical protein